MGEVSATYTQAEVARISKVPPSSVSYWKNTRLIVPTVPLGRWKFYSFEDLRDVVVAGQLRSQGATVRQIRPALTWVREHYGIERLAHADFFPIGKVIGFDSGSGQIVDAAKKGHAVMRLDLSGFEVNERGGVEYRPHRYVLISPRVLGGQPVVEGTRVPTRLLYELADIKAIRSHYPFLEKGHIRGAIEWEESLDRAA